jgi:hypothetical protein
MRNIGAAESSWQAAENICFSATCDAAQDVPPFSFSHLKCEPSDDEASRMAFLEKPRIAFRASR